MRRIGIGIALTLVLSALASVEPHQIPRSATHTYRKEGRFEGGQWVKANLEDIRIADHHEEGFERWVVDFSNEKRVWGTVAPRFQLTYSPADKVDLAEGKELIRNHPRFILRLQGIDRNFLTDEQVQEDLHKSKYVKKVVVYPQVENGDMALEIILREDVLFEPHQPMEREGRLVLDLRDTPQKIQ